MNVLITGGAGYLAGQLASFFSARGDNVTVISSSSAWVSSFGRVQFKKISWQDEDLIKEVLANKDLVIHAAGMSAQDCLSDPNAAQYFNGHITSLLVKLADIANVRRVIYLSTAHVYKSPLCGVIDESLPPMNDHPYATSHLAGERAILARSSGGQFDGVVLRLSNVYGRPMHNNKSCWNLFVNDLCRQAVEYKTMTIRSNVFQERDFISIEQVSKIVYLIATIHLGVNQKIINLGAGQSASLIKIAKLIQSRCNSLLGYSPEIIQLNNSTEFKSDLIYRSNVMNELGLIVEDDIEDSIDRLLNFCVSNFGNNRDSV
jgi:UDP-glucose 4-epimerase